MVVKLMDATKSRKWQITLKGGEWDWVTSTAWWPACKSTCTSRSQVALPERWASQRAQSQKRTQQMSNTTPRATLQTGKAAAIFRRKERRARSISRNTRPPLPMYHRWAGAGQQVQGDRPWSPVQLHLGQLCRRGPCKGTESRSSLSLHRQKFRFTDLVWEGLNCAGPSFAQLRPLALCTQRNIPGQEKSDRGDLLSCTLKPWKNTRCAFPSTRVEIGGMLEWFW